MKDFKFTIFHKTERIDDVFIDYVSASSTYEARKKIEMSYPKSKGYICWLQLR